MKFGSNNLVALISLVAMVISIITTGYVFVSTPSTAVTGSVVTTSAKVSMCVNKPPYINYSCGMRAYLGEIYYCDMNASSDLYQNVTFYDDSNLFDINPITGEILFIPNEYQQGIYYVNITAQDNSSCINDVNSTILTITVLSRIIDVNLNATKSEQGRVVLNWTDIPASIGYDIFISENPRSVLTMNLSNITNVSGINTNYWTDTNASNHTQMFYRIGVNLLDAYNISKRSVGKYDIDFVVNSDGSLGRKLFGIPFNTTYYVNPFIQEMCNYSATVTRLNRQNPNYENYEGHSCQSGSYNNFSMKLGDAFYIYLNESYNYTLTGRLATNNLTLKFIADSTGYFGRNLFGIHFAAQEYYAHPFLNEALCSYQATITRLSRDVVMMENYESHSCQSGSYNNFLIRPGDGYFMYVNTSYNYTIN